MIVLFDKHVQRIPLKIWLESLDQIEAEALQQALNLSRFPFAYRQIALMPDVHSGYGVPIGTVLAVEENVIPNAVGFDIGCGVLSALTPFDARDFPPDRLKLVLSRIHTVVRQGSGSHSQTQPGEIWNNMPLHLPLFQREERRVCEELGTLGGGNHFIEFQKDEQGRLWVMIHAGAGRIGRQTAAYFHEQARKLCEKKRAELPAPELSFLPLDALEGRDYLDALNWCTGFARENRRSIMKMVLDILEVELLDEIDVHHNYAASEEHFGRKVLVHRKGAIRVGEGQRAAIPGSMGSPSYIVQGRGNPESFLSCAHGAGRKLSPREAQRKISVNEVLENLKDRGVEVSADNHEELPARALMAYKDIDRVMSLQADLVEIKIKLTPMGVIRE